MIARGYRKLLSLAGMATVVVAPLGVLAWQANDPPSRNLSFNNSANQDQNQASSTPKSDSPKNMAEATAGSTPASGNSSKTTITINGQLIPLSPDGHTHTVVQNAGGTTTLDVSISNNVSGNAGSSQSSNNISLYSNSVTSVGGQSVSN